MFPGGGAQYVNMGIDLYRAESTFREQIDFCAQLLEEHLGYDMRTLLYPTEGNLVASADRLKQTSLLFRRCSLSNTHWRGCG